MSSPRHQPVWKHTENGLVLRLDRRVDQAPEPINQLLIGGTEVGLSADAAEDLLRLEGQLRAPVARLLTKIRETELAIATDRREVEKRRAFESLSCIAARMREPNPLILAAGTAASLNCDGEIHRTVPACPVEQRKSGALRGSTTILRGGRDCRPPATHPVPRTGVEPGCVKRLLRAARGPQMMILGATCR